MPVGSCAHLYEPDPPTQLYLVDDQYNADWHSRSREVTVFREIILDEFATQAEYICQCERCRELREEQGTEPPAVDVVELAIDAELKEKPYIRALGPIETGLPSPAQAPDAVQERREPFKFLSGGETYKEERAKQRRQAAQWEAAACYVERARQSTSDVEPDEVTLHCVDRILRAAGSLRTKPKS
jgi:hypothetical protein